MVGLKQTTSTEREVRRRIQDSGDARDGPRRAEADVSDME